MSDQPTNNPNRLRIIYTARTEKAINMAARNGFRPLMKTVTPGKQIHYLHCSRQKTWDTLHPTALPGTRHCADCSNSVHDTAAMTDQDLIALLKSNPSACLKVSFIQTNCSVRPR